MRKPLGFALPLCLTLLLLCGCGAEKQPLSAQPETAGTQAAEETPQPSETVGAEEEAEPAPAEITTEREEHEEMQMKIGDTVVAVEWEHNESVEALRALAEDQPLTVEMSMYGGFEQVGSLGQSLPRNDVQTTTSAGDIVLYSGNQIVVFYGSNSWAYTRLGRISGKTAEELTALLGNGDVTITIGKSW